MEEAERRLRASVFALADEVFEAMRDQVGVFIAVDDTRDKAYYAFGSGFLVHFYQKLLLVTAAHVVERIFQHGAVAFGTESKILGRKSFPIEHMTFVFDWSNDLAVAELDPDRLSSYGIEAAHVVRLDTEPQEHSEIAGFYGAVGYPAEWNNYKLGQVVSEFQGVTLWERVQKPKKCTIEDAVCFPFLPKKAFLRDASRPRRLRADFAGMSGGPIAQFSLALVEGEVRTHYPLVAVFVEWWPDKPCIVGASREALMKLLTTTLSC